MVLRNDLGIARKEMPVPPVQAYVIARGHAASIIETIYQDLQRDPAMLMDAAADMLIEAYRDDLSPGALERCVQLKAGLRHEE